MSYSNFSQCLTCIAVVREFNPVEVLLSVLCIGMPILAAWHALLDTDAMLVKVLFGTYTFNIIKLELIELCVELKVQANSLE